MVQKMSLVTNVNRCLIVLLMICRSTAQSWNQPRFTVNSTWCPEASTHSIVPMAFIVNPVDLFVNRNNTVYIAFITIESSLSQIDVWPQGSASSTRTLSYAFTSQSPSVFVTSNGVIYGTVTNPLSNDRVVRWPLGSTSDTTVVSSSFLNSIGYCTNIFVTTSDHIYCSSSSDHEIYKKLSSGSTTSSSSVAGTGSCGSGSTQLCNPMGIFVDNSSNLYVADSGNDRIQMFASGQSTATTKAGATASGTITLETPSGVILDADGYIFIVDKGKHRIVASNINGFRCIAGCGGSSGSLASQLNNPQTIRFDSYGNLLVADSNNARIQKFSLATSPCTVATTTTTETTKVYVATTNQPIATSTNIMQSTTDYRVTTTINIETTTNEIKATTNYKETTIHSTTTVITATESTSNEVWTTTSDQETTVHPMTTIITATESTSIEVWATTSDQETTVHPMTTVITATESTSNESRVTTNSQEISTDSAEITSIPISIQVSTPSTQTTMNLAETTTTRMQQELLTSTSHSIPPCVPPVIILIPDTSTLAVPLQFRRSEDFFILTNIQLHCNTSLSTITRWTIQNCTATICSYSIPIDRTIRTTASELYIPSRILSYGLYELKLTVIMTVSPNLTSSASAYVRILPSGVIANLDPLGTSMITHDYSQDLILDPGNYSIDPDGYTFNPSDWKYEYYCRIYGLSDFPQDSNSFIPIDNSNQSISYRYTGPTSSPKSAITILRHSLTPNRTYEFMLHIEHYLNSTIQATSYVLIQVGHIYSPLIAIGCVISRLCHFDSKFQRINPTNQLALFSLCLENYSSLINIRWNIYQGRNTNYSTVQWTLFNQMNQYENIWFFGRDTSNFTATQELFSNNPGIDLWQFEVTYTFSSGISTSALHFLINQSPRNGSCSIYPLNGTTSTFFNLSCSNWFDEDEIKDYSLYVWTTDISKRILIAFNPVSDFQVRLPAGHENNFLIHIRDRLDCVAEFHIRSMTVTTDSVAVDDLVYLVEHSPGALTSNSLVELLSSKNQNTVGQILLSLCQEFNQINQAMIEHAIANGISSTSIFVSSLHSSTIQNVSDVIYSFNISTLNEYTKQLNTYAIVRDYLLTYVEDLLIADAYSIILQASVLVQLTEATNQLTRSAATIASDKCFHLAQGLFSIANIISDQNVKSAVIQIVQCMSNVITAIHGPLQQRTIVLNLDQSRANNFPEDYDTDLESEWANPNLFADGNDFSWETIEKGRNLYYQKQIAERINDQAMISMKLLTSALNIHLNLGQNLTINTSAVFMSLEIISVDDLLNKTIQSIGNAQIQLPSDLYLNSKNNQTVSIRSIVQPLAPAESLRPQSNTNLSTSISLSILDRDGQDISVSTSFNQSFRFVIPRDSNLVLPSMVLQNVTSLNSTSHNLLFNLHYVEIMQSNNLTVSIHIEMKPLNTSLAYLFIYKFDSSPQLNSSINQTDGGSLFCPSNQLTNENIYTYFIDNQLTKDHQSLVFGLRELNSTEMTRYCFNQSINSLPIPTTPFNFTSDYHLRVYTSGCYYLDSDNSWQSNGLTVGSVTNHNETECFSTHLTTFAGGFIVLPSPINWNYVFANADFNKNKTIYLTVICVSILYFLFSIYARYKDKKDIEKLGVTALPDNDKKDRYCYQIIVFTGHRKDAGTKSRVHFIIAGEQDETKVRIFSDPHRQIFQRGGIDAFVITVPKPLGVLNYIRLWHDHSGAGSSSSWFLKYIIIRDLQTLEKSHFICQQWFAVEKDDGRIDRVLPVAGELQKREFSYLLSKQAYHNVSEDHLWFSIFSRPPSNRFTRVQRCTCCFVLFFTSMLFNILYYDQVNEAKTKNSQRVSLSLGPLYITPEQIGIGVIVELLVFVPSLILVQFFRRIRPRRSEQQLSPLRAILSEIKNKPISKTTPNIINKKRSQCTLPWWCLFIAYGFSLLLTAVSIFFIIVRGIEFGDLKTQKWLTSLISGFFSSILLIQPIKIVSLAIFFSCFIRKTDNDKQAAEYFDDDAVLDLNDDEEYLHAKNSSVRHQHPIRETPLNGAELTFLRHQRIKELRMWSIIREVSTYILYLVLLYLTAYSNLYSNAFYQVNHLRNFLANQEYTEISNIHEYWNWLENNFVYNLRAQSWYNGERPRNLSGYINDKTNRLIGWATMRQLRVKSETCFQSNSSCQYDYSFSNEEKQSFYPEWLITNQTNSIYSSTIFRSFQYQNGKNLDTYIYIGNHESYNSGGYVYEYRGRLDDLRSNLSKLHQLGWIDRQTRAVIIQLTLYNPNVQLFTSVTLLVEFLSTGSVHSQSRFEPLSFQIFSSVFHLVCSILYLVFIIYLIIQQIGLFVKVKRKYFSQFWSYINLGIIICSWTSVGIYVWKYQESERIGELFQQTNGYVYINLQFAGYINDIYVYLIGFCCFFGTIKLIHLCRYNRRLLLFTETIHHAAKELVSFVLVFGIVFMSFICLFYLLFISKLSTCSNLLATAQMLFEMSLMKFDAYELLNQSSFLGPVSFTLFILLVVFVCLNMFISIINDSFRFVRDNIKIDSTEDYEVIRFFFRKIQQWMGFAKPDKKNIFGSPNEPKVHLNPVEHFPEKIDELFNAFSRLYNDHQQHTLKPINHFQ